MPELLAIETDKSSVPDLFVVEAGKSFRGWLPTVTGRLSFSVFGDTSYPSKTLKVNVADEDTRYLLVSQLRNQSDSILPKLVLKSLRFLGFHNLDSNFHYVLAAKTARKDFLKTQEYLEGKAYIIDDAGWNLANSFIKKYEVNLSSFRSLKNVSLPKDLESFNEVHHCLLIQELEKISVFNVLVRIARTGTTNVKYDEKSIIYNGALPLSESQIQKNCSQVFFFLKDIGHHHQHHDKRTDTIVDLHQIKNDHEGDLKWRSDTLYNIYRSIIKFRRNEKSLRFNDCIGLIAYSDTFRKISALELSRDLRRSLPVYYSKQLVQSLEATQSKIERKIEEAIENKDKTRNLLIAIFGILVGYIGLMQFTGITDKNYSPGLGFVLGVLLMHPALCLFVGVFLYFALPFVLRPNTYSPNLHRLFAGFPKVVFLYALIGFGIFALIASVFLLLA